MAALIGYSKRPRTIVSLLFRYVSSTNQVNGRNAVEKRFADPLRDARDAFNPLQCLLNKVAGLLEAEGGAIIQT